MEAPSTLPAGAPSNLRVEAPPTLPAGAPSNLRAESLFRDFKKLESEVIVLEDIKNFITRLVVSTHPAASDIPEVRKYVLYGASPRAGIALLQAAKWKALLENRVNVSFEDVEDLSYDVLNHRIILNFDGESEYVDTRNLVLRILQELGKRYRPKK